jgi:cytochrome c peroxidase
MLFILNVERGRNKAGSIRQHETVTIQRRRPRNPEIRLEGSETSGRGNDQRLVFFNTGVSTYAGPNRGLFEHTQRAEDIGKFRAPSLRNIAITGTYMHNGSLATLEQVVDHYAAGGRVNHSNKSHILRKLPLTDGDRRDLVEQISRSFRSRCGRCRTEMEAAMSQHAFSLVAGALAAMDSKLSEIP